MTQAHETLTATVAILVLGCIVAIIDLSSNQMRLESDSKDIVWSYRQLVFSRYVEVLDKTEMQSQSQEIRLMVLSVRETIKRADRLLEEGNINRALPTLREASYMTGHLESYLSCGRSSCR